MCMDVRAYAEKDGVIFLSFCSLPYSALQEFVREAEINSEKILFFRFFENGERVRLTLGCSDLTYALRALEKASNSGAVARCITGCTVFTLYSMGCRKSGLAAYIVGLCEEERIELHHIGITDTEISICVGKKDREKLQKALPKRLNFIT